MKMFTVQEAAEQLHMSIPWVRQKIYRREIEFLRIGRRVFISEETVEAILKQAIVKPKTTLCLSTK